MKKIIFGLMMIMGVVMFTSCDPNAGSNDYIDDDETIVTPTDPVIDEPTDPVISNENLSFEIDYGNNGYVKFLGATLSNGTLVYKGKSYKVYNNVSTSKCKIVVDGLETEVMYSKNNTGVTMYIKNVESVTYTVTTVGTTTTTVFAVTTK